MGLFLGSTQIKALNPEINMEQYVERSELSSVVLSGTNEDGTPFSYEFIIKKPS